MIMDHYGEKFGVKKARQRLFLLAAFPAFAIILLFVFASSEKSWSSLAAEEARPVARPDSEPSLTPPQEIPADEIAKFISGMPCSVEPLKELEETPEWKNFADSLQKSWSELDTKRLEPMRAWATEELTESNAATHVLFYPFGGPDILTAFVFFPRADVYVLLGLERTGSLPQFHAAAPESLKRVGDYLSNLNSALADFFNKSYFITKNMNATLTGKVDGVLPILCFFLKRMKMTITGIQRCEFLENGEIVEFDFTLPLKRIRRPDGVKVEFVAEGMNTVRSVYYFSCDLANEVLRKDSSFYLYLDRLSYEATFIKSASYLMHYKEFSHIRDMVLTKSRFVLEDDTGIPYRYFSPAEWDVQLYGEYVKPVSDFAGVEQEDLKAAFADTSRVHKLPFHLGYHWGSSKDAILYIKRKRDSTPR
jgi:hypothetical protein